MAIQLLHWCFTRRGETEAQREEREFNAQLQDDSDFLNEEANQIFSNMKLCPDKGKVALLHHYKIGDEAMHDLFKHFDRNTICLQLNLSHNIISDEGAGYCAHALRKNSTLLELNLCYNKIGDDGMARIGEALRKNTCLLELQIGENDFEDEGALHIADALHVNYSLTALCMGDSRVGDLTACSLGKALQVNNTLTRLDLFNCRIGDQGALGLAQGLLHRVEVEDEHVEDLNLGKNNITDQGGLDLIKFVGVSKKIKVFQLYKNRLTDVCMESFIKELEKNTSLTQVNIGGNRISKPAIIKFYKALSAFKEREKDPCKLNYINTYQCIEWGTLDPEAQEQYDKWLAAQKAAQEAEKLGKKIEVEVPCDSCKKKLAKLPQTPWPEWICNGCEKNLSKKDICYACETVASCDFAYCAGCYERQASIIRQQRIEEQLSGKDAVEVDVPCEVCKKKISSVQPHPWPQWLCNKCEKEGTNEDPLYACATCNDCDFGLCKACFTKAETQMRLDRMGEKDEEEAAKKQPEPEYFVFCETCWQPAQKAEPGPWPAWSCSGCGQGGLTAADDCYVCATVAKCDFGFCGKCFRQKLQEAPGRQVCCDRCQKGMVPLPGGPGSEWGCDGCEQGPLPAGAPCFTCPTPDDCDFMYCGSCFKLAGDIMQKHEGPKEVPCGNCDKPLHLHDPNPWPGWCCNWCERQEFTDKDPVYGCEAMLECDFGLCKTCFLKMALKLALGLINPDEEGGGDNEGEGGPDQEQRRT
eukprot:TRINITY_DN16151_c0_g1_i1.p1 TRINITY_DN16151_c0_g1~~TRINITY_DN16151_c0_g1_i1.p1  ORF type:complete len:753 (+),score=343.55 TRINITY_DN16151_c0_g1_i1:151-2409(+)